MYHFSERSNKNLMEASDGLIVLFKRVIQHRDCSVICGHREKAEQNMAFEAGASEVKWPDSNHNSKPSRAVDVVPYPISWDDIEGFEEFGTFVLGVAAGLGIGIVWGGSWEMRDYPHFELAGE